MSTETHEYRSDFARRYFSDVGSAGGHRAMAKAVVPMQAFRKKFGDVDVGALLQQLVAEFRHEPARDKHEPAKDKDLKGQKVG